MNICGEQYSVDWPTGMLSCRTIQGDKITIPLRIIVYYGESKSCGFRGVNIYDDWNHNIKQVLDLSYDTLQSLITQYRRI